VAVIGLGGVTVLTGRAEAPPAAPYRAPPGEQTGPPPPPNMPRARSGTFGPAHDVTITAGRTGFNDRELVLLTGTLQGNRPTMGPDDGCGAEVWVDVVEDHPDAVVLRARAATARRPMIGPPFGPEIGCLAIGIPTHVVGRLGTPLGGRPILDATLSEATGPPLATMREPGATDGGGGIGGTEGARAPVVEIQRPPIFVPAWLPAGYSLRSESAGRGSWSFTYGLADPTPGRPPVTVTVGRQLSLIPNAPPADAPS